MLRSQKKLNSRLNSEGLQTPEVTQLVGPGFMRYGVEVIGVSAWKVPLVLPVPE